jgi:tetratricopeptide (TPR) repeat protein
LTLMLAGPLASIMLAPQVNAQEEKTCYTQTGDAAIAACTRAINSGRLTGRDLAGTFLYRGTAYKGNRDFDRAIADFSEAIRLNPDSPFAYGQRGLVYNQMSDYDRAIADLTRFIALNPGRQYLADAYIARAMAYAAIVRATDYADKDRFDSEIADLTKAIALRPDYALLFKTRGSAYELKGQHDMAIADYRAVLRIDPADRDAKDGLKRLGAAPQLSMAAEVLARLETTEDYRKLSELYNRKVAAGSNWLQSAEGLAVDAQLKNWRNDAAATAIVDAKEGRILRYSIGGVIVTDAGIAEADLEKNPAYRRTMSEAIAQNILTSPRDPKVQTALATAGSAHAAASDNFCAQIQAIVADAPNSFTAFRGQLTRQETSQVPPPTTVDHYAASGAPGGTTACEITARHTATDTGRYLPNYTCEFPISGTNKGAATRSLASRVAACLPGISRPMGPGLSKDSGMLTAHSSDYSLSYLFLSGPASQTTTFSIQNGRK